MINDSTNGLTRSDESIGSQETPAQAEVERSGFSLGKTLRSPRNTNTIIAIASPNEISVRGLRSDLPSEKPERSTSICAGASVSSIA